MDSRANLSDRNSAVEVKKCSRKFVARVSHNAINVSPQSPTHQSGNPTPPGCRSGVLRYDAPIVVGGRRDDLFSLDPVDYQLTNLLTGSIDHGRVFVHRVAAATVHSIIIGSEPKLL